MEGAWENRWRLSDGARRILRKPSDMSHACAALLQKGGSIFRARNVHRGLVERGHNNKQYATLSYKGTAPWRNMQPHSISTREKRKKLQENVLTRIFC